MNHQIPFKWNKVVHCTEDSKDEIIKKVTKEMNKTSSNLMHVMNFISWVDFRCSSKSEIFPKGFKKSLIAELERLHKKISK